MINNSDSAASKSTSDYIENMRQKIGYGHSDKADTRTAKKELGKDDFIKLMSTQLKYQDPTSPLKNEEMAAQLAQFSGLEQMQNVNRNLEKMAGGNEMRDNMMAASLIGKRVETDASKFKLTEDRKVKMNFELGADVEKGKLAIVDSKGTVVRELLIDKLQKGKQEIPWDGRNEKGSNAELSEYTFRVTAYNKEGKPVEAKTSTSGIVTGIEFEKGKPVMLVGKERIYMDVVSRIESVDPAAQKAATAAAGPTSATPGLEGAGRDPSAAMAQALELLNGRGNAPGAMPGNSPENAAGDTAAKNSDDTPAAGWPSQMNPLGDAHKKVAAAEDAAMEKPMVIDDVDHAAERNQLAQAMAAAAAAKNRGGGQ